jgi:L-aspartate oxidase
MIRAMEPPPETLETDFVVVGSGVAGLRAAIAIAEAQREVWLLTKDLAEDSSSRLAQGGIAAVLSDEDRVGFHESDTIAAGDGLSEPEAVKVLVEEGPRYVIELIGWGTEFDHEGFRLAFTREAAHGTRRILNAEGDSTGREIVRALLLKTDTFPNIRFVPHAFTAGLIVRDGECRGVLFQDEETGRMKTLRSRAVLLATGGCGRVFRETTNPAQATGDGVALAWRAGAEILDEEFIQFHPTALALPGAPRFLLSEALRGEGALLRDESGERFMVGRHPQAELAPRDVVSRGIVEHLAETGGRCAYLDLTHLPESFLRERFPRIHETCLASEIDLARDQVPVLPAAHYAMGGVRTDLEGRTSVTGLYAAGEVAGTGVHGANRLASNSLLEGLVFGARAGEAMVEDLYTHPDRSRVERTASEEGSIPAALPADAAGRIREIAWTKVGITRRAESLRSAIDELSRLAPRREKTDAGVSRAGMEAENLRLIALLAARGALAREETRGGHLRSDFPKRDDAHWAAHSLQRAGSEEVARIPVGRLNAPVPSAGALPSSGSGTDG